MFYSLLDLRSSECDVVSLYVVYFSVNLSVCFVCCVFDSVCEWFGETIRNVFVYVDRKYNEISLTFTAGSVYLFGVCSHVTLLGLSVRLSRYPIWVR